MAKLGRDEFYKIAGVKQHAEFEKYLRDILLDQGKREDFYNKLLEVNYDVYYDTFKQYFEEYAAERKSNQQDYTPDSVSYLISELSRSNPGGGYSSYDPTAGTGSLLIQSWRNDQLQESIFSYAPHNYLYRADEMADNAIPYLLHNLALRGMNCIVVHQDVLEGVAKQVYFIQNAKDDFMSYSNINVMPHTEQVAKEFGITKWEEPAIDHIENELNDVKFIPTLLPMKKKAIEVNPNSKPSPSQFGDTSNSLKLKDVATIERARAKKVYPRGTIIIQLSATRGQIGLLTSSGEVGSQYACIDTDMELGYLFNLLKVKAPKHFRRVQQGLNLVVHDLETIPLDIPKPQLTAVRPLGQMGVIPIA